MPCLLALQARDERVGHNSSQSADVSSGLFSCVQAYHKLCLKCNECQKSLEPRLLVDHDGVVRLLAALLSPARVVELSVSLKAVRGLMISLRLHRHIAKPVTASSLARKATEQVRPSSTVATRGPGP